MCVCVCVCGVCVCVCAWRVCVCVCVACVCVRACVRAVCERVCVRVCVCVAVVRKDPGLLFVFDQHFLHWILFLKRLFVVVSALRYLFRSAILA